MSQSPGRISRLLDEGQLSSSPVARTKLHSQLFPSSWILCAGPVDLLIHSAPIQDKLQCVLSGKDRERRSPGRRFGAEEHPNEFRVQPMEEKLEVERLFGTESPNGLPGLRDAVDATLEVRRVLASFRSRCLLCPDYGELFVCIYKWYRGKYMDFRESYPKVLEERNPYAKFKSQNSKEMRKWSSKLDFLLTEIPPSTILNHMDLDVLVAKTPPPSRISNYKLTGIPHMELRLKEEECNQLLKELRDNGPLVRLIRVSPYLTHLENIMIAVVDARLWLNNSELPVDILSGSITYKDVRMGASFTRDNDAPPSTFEMSLREVAVAAYWSMQLSNSSFMYQPKPTDFPRESRDCYFARLARVRFTHTDNMRISEAEYAAVLAKFPVEDMGAEELDDWKWTETASMYKHLARLIFDVEV